MRLGYFLSTEEFRPHELVEQARLAEEAGFDSLWISDHFHPWNEAQGQASFVWSLLGALSQVTTLPVTTAVTCPTVRINPVVIAQAAATTAVMHEGRFILGVGSGEALNEHILGDPWPSAATRLDMLEEAVALIREMWTGRTVTHRGEFYEVDSARLYTLPRTPPKIYMSAFGQRSTEVAVRIADGYQSVVPDRDLLSLFHRGNAGPTQGGLKVCHAPTEDEGVAIAHRLWAHQAIPGQVHQLLPSPHHFEELATFVPDDSTRGSIACGPDPDRQLAAIQPFVDAGFDEVYVGNIGPHYREMIRQFGEQVIPRVHALPVA